jgi:hypothetical protein
MTFGTIWLKPNGLAAATGAWRSGIPTKLEFSAKPIRLDREYGVGMYVALEKHRNPLPELWTVILAFNVQGHLKSKRRAPDFCVAERRIRSIAAMSHPSSAERDHVY